MTQSRSIALRAVFSLLLWVVLGLAVACPERGFATDLPVYGGLGGNSFRAECPKGSYLVGLAGRTGSWVDRIAPVCAPWLRGSQTLGAPTIGPSFGMSTGGQERQTICATTHVIQSWWIHPLRSDDHYVQYVEVFCTVLTVPVSVNSGLRLGFGNKPNDVEEMVTGGPFGFGSHPPFQGCAAGEAAVGIRVRAGKFLDAMGLICGPVPVTLGVPATKLPGPLVQAPPPVTPMNPQAKNMRIPDDMFVIIKPGAGEKIPHGQLVITATEPKVGSTNMAELELQYLDAPAKLKYSYPYTTIIAVSHAQLLTGYPVTELVTGGYVGRWQVRARSSMKTSPGPWSSPVQFNMIKAQAPPPMVQMPKLNAPITQTPTPNTGVAPAMVRPPATSSGGAAGSLMVRPRGVEAGAEQGATSGAETKP